MKKAVIAVVLLLLVCTLNSAMADFSYQFSLPEHNIVVTALGNGKMFLRFDGTLYESKNSIDVEDGRNNLFRLYNGGHALAMDLHEGIALKIRILDANTPAPKSKALSQMIFEGKTITKEEGSIGDIYSPQTFIFGYRQNTPARIYEVVQLSQKDAVPEEFASAIRSLKVRRIAR